MTRREALEGLRSALLVAHMFHGRRWMLAAATVIEVYLSEQPSRAPAGVIVLAERRRR